DDVVLIAARAEPAAAAGDHDRADVVLAAELLEALGELAVDVEGQRVEPLGAIERDRRDPARQLERERARLDHPGAPEPGSAMYAVAWISISAPGSTRPVTPTRVIAGKWRPNRARHAGPRSRAPLRYAATSVTNAVIVAMSAGTPPAARTTAITLSIAWMNCGTSSAATTRPSSSPPTLPPP